MKIIFRITSVLSLLLYVSCASVSNRTENPHPPTYNDFLKLQSPKHEEMSEDYFLRRIDLLMCISPVNNTAEKIDEKKAAEIKQNCIKNKSDEQILDELDQNLEFKKAIQFTVKEMNIIRQSKNLNAIVGAGIQSELDDNLGTELLVGAAETKSATGLSLISLLDRYFALSKANAEGNLSSALQSTTLNLLQTDPDNAFSYYLNGYRLHKDKKDNEALLQLIEGNKRKFNNYSKERYFAVVKAAESIGYSQFTARLHAMNYSTPTELYSSLVALCKGLLTTEKKEDAKKECLSMGEKIELSSGTIFEKLQGLIIQSLACRKSTDPKDVELMSKIIERQRITLETSPKLLKIPFNEIPEPVWLQYFEIYFSQDEKSAGSFIEDYYKKTRQGNGK